MWLINTRTLTLAEHNESAPPYAILSHTWQSDQEVTFQEFLTPTETTRAKSGWKKIEACAILAETDQLSYLWVDTCCIDKTSSAEISEAVNSMFEWYSNSSKCYAYMSDVQSGTTSEEQFVRDFRDSRWHTRGWTLQELIAPRDVDFYDRNWIGICSRNDNTELLSYITGIPEDVLDGGDLEIYSVAEKMSWAAKRITTRPEDRAYCLLGLFDVSMPLLYGEGRERAFTRLQQHIIESIDDQTILAWDPLYQAGHSHQPTDLAVGHTLTAGQRVSVLAPEPASFRIYGLHKPIASNRIPYAYTMTNKGLSGVFFICQVDRDSDLYNAILECGENPNKRSTILLVKLSQTSNRFARIAMRTGEIDTRDVELRTSTLTANSFPLPKDDALPSSSGSSSSRQQRSAQIPAGAEKQVYHARSIFIAQNNLYGAPRSAIVGREPREARRVGGLGNLAIVRPSALGRRETSTRRVERRPFIII